MWLQYPAVSADLTPHVVGKFVGAYVPAPWGLHPLICLVAAAFGAILFHPALVPTRASSRTITPTVAPITIPTACRLNAATSQRPRSREAGIMPGYLSPGEYNAITDVPGVLVGQVTLIEGERVPHRITAPNKDGIIESASAWSRKTAFSYCPSCSTRSASEKASVSASGQKWLA